MYRHWGPGIRGYDSQFHDGNAVDSTRPHPRRISRHVGSYQPTYHNQDMNATLHTHSNPYRQTNPTFPYRAQTQDPSPYSSQPTPLTSANLGQYNHQRPPTTGVQNLWHECMYGDRHSVPYDNIREVRRVRQTNGRNTSRRTRRDSAL